jgi:hypothetical protein
MWSHLEFEGEGEGGGRVRDIYVVDSLPLVEGLICKVTLMYI